MNNQFLVFLAFFIFSIASLAKELENPISVVVSIPPQKYFVEQIAGNLAKVTIMVPKGFEPEDYEPRPQQLKALTNAALYLAIDVPFELIWLKKFLEINPNMKMVFTNQGITKIKAAPDHTISSFVLPDPHIWLSPQLVKIQANHIKNAFIQIDPKHAAIYQKNYQQFEQQINQLDHSIKMLFNQKKLNKSSAFLIFHPSLGYFAKAYGLTQVAVETDGKSPTLKQLNHLIAFAKQHQIKTLFITPEYAPKEADIIANAISGKTQLIDPLSEAWMSNMKHIANAVFQSSNHE